jgi:hypothetical protein
MHVLARFTHPSEPKPKRLLHVLAYAVVAAPTIGSPADDERIAALRQLVSLATGVVQRHIACEIATNELEQLTVAVSFDDCMAFTRSLSPFFVFGGKNCGQACTVSDAARDADLLESCLAFFDMFVNVGAPAPGAVRSVLASLCRAVNVDQFAARSWEITRALLSQPQHGHRGVRALCSLLRDPSTAGASHVRRGAVFCLGMACWGSRRVTALDVSAAVLLPVLIAALDDAAGTSAIVAHEIALAARRLVRKFASTLALEWDLVLELLLRLAPYVEQSKDSASFAAVLQDLLSSVEQLHAAGQYVGSPKLWAMVSARFLTLPGGVRAALHLPPEDGSTATAAARAGVATSGESPLSPTPPARGASGESIVPSGIDSAVLALSPGSPAWPIALQRVLAECWRSQSSKTRLEAIDVFERLFQVHKYLFEVELIDKLALPLLELAMQEADLGVSGRAFAFLAPVLSELQSNRFLDAVALLLAGASAPSAPTAEQCTGTLGSLLATKFTRPPAAHVNAVFEALCNIAVVAPQLPSRRAAVRHLSLVNADERFRMRLGAAVSPYLRCVVPQAGGPAAATGVEPMPTDRLMDAYLAQLRDEQQQSSDLPELALSGLIGVLQNCYLAFALDLGGATVAICDWLDAWHAGALPTGAPLCAATVSALRHLVPHSGSLSAEQQTRLCTVLVRGVGAAPTTALRCSCVDAVAHALLELPAAIFRAGNLLGSALTALMGVPRTTETFLSTLSFCNVLVGVREARDAVTSAHVDDLLRYVLHFCDPNKSNVATFAFEALGRWVLAVPVRERAKRCAIVIETIEALTQRGCSLAEAHHELFARYLYSDVRPGLYPTPFRSALVGDFGGGAHDDPMLNERAKHWLFGNAVMTVRIGAAGFVHVQRRSPGGADSYVLQHLAAVSSHRLSMPFAPTLMFAPATSARAAQSTSQGAQQWFADVDSLVAGTSAKATASSPTSLPVASPATAVVRRALRLPLLTSPSSLSTGFFVPESSPRGQRRELDIAADVGVTLPSSSTTTTSTAAASVISTTTIPSSPLTSAAAERFAPLPSYDDEDDGDATDSTPPSATLAPSDDAAAPAPAAARKRADVLSDSDLLTTLMHPAMAILRQYPFLHEQPIELENGPPLWRSIGVLDRTLCLTTHKVGIVYVGPGQSALDVALRNGAGSSRYNAMLHQLGHFERLVDGEPARHRYTGGLDRTGGDGEHALFWSDQLSLIVYHVCTLMPNREGDAACTNKLRHIGNDYVNIVFSANDEPFNASQFRGQFNFVTVVIYPKRLGMYKIDVVHRSLQMRAAVVTSSVVVSKHALVPLLRATVIAADEAAAELVDGHRRRQANAEVRLLQIKSMSEKQKV